MNSIKKLKKLKKIIIILLIAAVSSCATVRSSNGKNYKSLYKDSVNDYNTLLKQERDCSKLLGDCVNNTEINQDLIRDMKRKQTREKWTWAITGFGIGVITITGIGLIILIAK